MTIIITTKVTKKQLVKFFRENNYLLSDFYSESLKITKEIERNLINSYLNSLFRFILDGDRILGFYRVEKLLWDSEVFGKSIGKLDLTLIPVVKEGLGELESSILSDIVLEKIQHISCQVSSNNFSAIHFLEKMGFECMDSIIRFGISLTYHNLESESSLVAKNTTVRIAKEEDKKGIINLSKEVFKNYPNRFQNDPFFSKEDCDRLYSKWTENSLNGYANVTVVAEKENEIIGFSTVKYRKHQLDSETIIAEGQLAGVSSNSRGKGINTKMLLKRLAIASQNANYYEVGTQIYNYASQKTFYKCGLRPIASYSSFHKTIKT